MVSPIIDFTLAQDQGAAAGRQRVSSSQLGHAQDYERHLLSRLGDKLYQGQAGTAGGLRILPAHGGCSKPRTASSNATVTPLTKR
jgi:hypothetical protein